MASAYEPAGDLPRGARFLLRATERLHAYGTPAHRLERVVTEFAARFDLRVQVFSTPTSIFVGMAPGEGEREDVHLIRVEPGGVDLGRLVELDELMEGALAGTVTPDEAYALLDEYEHASARGSLGLQLVGHALAAGTAAMFFGGGLADVGLSAGIGALIALVATAAHRREGAASILDPLAAFLAAAVAFAAASLSDGQVDARIVSIASIIVIVPGLSLTVAFVELATRHLASGTARLAGSITAFLTIAFGALLGRLVVRRGLGLELPTDEATRVAHAGTAWLGSLPALAVGLVLASIGFAILFRVRRSELMAVVGGSALGFAAARTAGALVSGDTPEAAVEGAAMAAFAGALAVGLFSNAYARFKDRPATVPLVPGLLVLVPGSVGYRALSAFTERDALVGIDGAFQVLLLAAALVGGLLAANALLPPRRIL
ncbi:MAG: threonine/serine exporter family protein [Planctomycetota bacterium]